MTMTTTPIGIARAAEVVASGSRWSGAAAGFSVAVVASLIGFGFGAPYLALGVPAATVAGWFLGPKVGAAGGLLGMAVAMGVVTVAVADAMVVVGSAGMSAAYGGSDLLAMIVGAVVMWGIGFVIFGIPMTVITVPCGVVWAVLVRLYARESARVDHAATPDLERRAA